jgi:hippurate hydrolase
MTSLVGTAQVLSKLKNQWQGTIVFIGQPAEERGAGARAMLGDGLFERFPAPDHALALHVNSELPAGQVAFTSGYAMANVDSVDITIRGVGGHGAYPHTAKDPVVLAAETVLSLQTIVSREIEPIEPAVVTVGSIHGGTKHNIIPDEVKLQLTVRSYSDEVREQIFDAIRRKTHGLAIAAGVPSDRLPTVVVSDEYTPAVHNDPELTQRLAGVFRQWLGEENVIERKPVMGGEDFGRYGRTEHKIPICMFFVGGVKQEKYDASRESGNSLPSLHSPLFAPDPEPTIRTAVTAMSAAALELLNEQE